MTGHDTQYTGFDLACRRLGAWQVTATRGHEEEHYLAFSEDDARSIADALSARWYSVTIESPTEWMVR